MPIDVRDGNHLRELLSKTDTLVVIDFTATWCGPCQRISPLYDRLSQQHPTSLFLKVWEHQCRELIVNMGVRAFPTFHFYLNNAKVDECGGRDLERKVAEWAAKVQGGGMKGPITTKLVYERKVPREKGGGFLVVNDEVHLDVDPREGLEVLQFQIMSVSEVEVDMQLITDSNGKTLVTDSDLSAALALRGGGGFEKYPVLTMKTKSAVSQAQGDSTATLPSSNGAEALWATCCTGVLFGNMPILQPAYAARLGEEPIHLMCHACHNASMNSGLKPGVTIVYAPAIAAAIPFACQSAKMVGTILDADPFISRRNERSKLPPTDPRSTVQSLRVAARQKQPASSEQEASFRNRVESGLQGARAYESQSAQAAARALIPLDEMNRQAIEGAAGVAGGKEEMLVTLLLKWFKTEFFAWTDKPDCEACGSRASSQTIVRGVAPNDHEKSIGWAARVELYRCDNCGSHTRFPRINNPEELLKSRRGRCGEWANCFTLCCRAIGLRARIVHDWTDHVWTEIWIPALKRWAHADSCEQRFDAPLLYEAGWGKKLNYCIAVGLDGPVDVTLRYTRKIYEVWSRRIIVSEQWLSNLLEGITQRLRQSISQQDKNTLQPSWTAEVVELASFRALCLGDTKAATSAVNTTDLEGRTSGSKAWIASRGEDGDNKIATCAVPTDTINTTATSISSSKTISASPSEAVSLMRGMPLAGCTAAGGVTLDISVLASCTKGTTLSLCGYSIAIAVNSASAAIVCGISAVSGCLLFAEECTNEGKWKSLPALISSLPGAVVVVGGGSGDVPTDAWSALCAITGCTEAVPAPSSAHDTWSLIGFTGTSRHKEWCGIHISPYATSTSTSVRMEAVEDTEEARESSREGAHIVELADRMCAIPLAIVTDPGTPDNGDIKEWALNQLSTHKDAGAYFLSYCTGDDAIPAVLGGGGAPSLVDAPGWKTYVNLPPHTGGVGPVTDAEKAAEVKRVFMHFVSMGEDPSAAAARALVTVANETAAHATWGEYHCLPRVIEHVTPTWWRSVYHTPCVGASRPDTVQFCDAFPCSIVTLPDVAEIIGWVAPGPPISGFQTVYSLPRGSAEDHTFHGVRHVGEQGDHEQSHLQLKDPDEVVKKIVIKASPEGIVQVQITTSTGNSLSWGDDQSSVADVMCTTVSIPDNAMFIGFCGGVGDTLDNLGVVLVEEGGKAPDAITVGVSVQKLELSDDPLYQAIAALYKHNTSATTSKTTSATSVVVSACIGTAVKYSRNAVSAPTDPKRRRIRVKNAIFSRDVGTCIGGCVLMDALGWKLVCESTGTSSELCFLLPSDFSMDVLKERCDVVEQILRTLQ